MEMLKKSLAISLWMCINSALVYSQGTKPESNFRSPVNFPIALSGSFGEVRKNHFHSGIDIRTGGEVGKPVYAVADGYVSRVFISPYGFGKALYLNHPAGYTSVYGHLDKFSPGIARFVRTEQYKKESFSLNEHISPGTIVVKKGELIGYSGNSGSSGGPHLHFEIRDAATQEPMDPIALGIRVSDVIKPRIIRIRIYPADHLGMVNFANRPLSFPITGNDGIYTLPASDTIMVSGNIFFGIEAYDYHNGSSIRLGVSSVTLLVDGMLVFSQKIDRFSFADTRYVNSMIDYSLNNQTNQRVMRSYIAPGNQLHCYPHVEERGIVRFYDNRVHQIQYIVKDVSGNTSRLSWWVKSHPPAAGGGARPLTGEPEGVRFSWNSNHVFENEYIRLGIPVHAIYEDLNFTYSTSSPVSGCYSRIHWLHSEDTPLHKSCEVEIRVESLPAGFQRKVLIAKLDEKNRFQAKGGTYENGYVRTRISEFGKYVVTIDTIAPVIRPLNIYPTKNISKQHTIQVRISDNLSGIRSYRGTLNNQWILMDYDPKRNLLEYTFDDRLKPGKNTFRLVVVDDVGNKTEYSANLIR